MTENKNNKNNKNAREEFFKYILGRICSRFQAEEYLKRKKINESERENLLNEAEELNLIDDLNYAKIFIDSHLNWGNKKISFELMRRKISRENIKLAFEDCENETSRIKKFISALNNSLDENKIISRLRSRGFNESSIRSALNSDDIEY